MQRCLKTKVGYCAYITSSIVDHPLHLADAFSDVSQGRTGKGPALKLSDNAKWSTVIVQVGKPSLTMW